MDGRASARLVSKVGFVQQLAVGFVCRGYWFYVTGWIPEEKDPRAVDEKLTKLYGVGLTKSSRMRRKLAGRANVQYLRLGRFFVIIATHGFHQFFENEGMPSGTFAACRLPTAGIRSVTEEDGPA